MGLKHIAIDTMLMIYLLEGNSKHKEKIKKLIKKADKVTFSTMGFGEVLAGLQKKEDQKNILSFISFMEQQEKIQLRPFGLQEALNFANLRAHSSIKAPDAIHLATAICSGAEAFITNDSKLKKTAGFPVLSLKDL